MNGRIGAIIPTTSRPETIVPMSRFIEEARFDELWVAEDYFFYGGFSSAAMALQSTESIDVGIGIFSAVVRHPAVTAMEISTLVNAYPGRFRPGIGHGVPFWTRQMGLLPKKPLSVFREAAIVIRRLLDGETVSQADGRFHFDDVTLTHPSPSAQLLAGVIGPKSLGLSGEIMDGTVLSVLAGPKYVEYAREHTNQGMRKAGRTGAHEITTFTLFSVDDDSDKAKSNARDAIAFYLAALGPTPMSGVYGWNDALSEMIESGGAPAVSEQMPKEWLDELCVAGTPEECATAIERHLEAGSSSVVLFPIPVEESLDQLRRAAEQVLPQLR